MTLKSYKNIDIKSPILNLLQNSEIEKQVRSFAGILL